LLNDVHDAAMAARGQNDQALALQVVRGSQLMAELVRDRASRLLVGWQTVDNEGPLTLTVCSRSAMALPARNYRSPSVALRPWQP
jgi:hypothetical protein